MLEELNIEIREATTRYVEITCKNQETGEDFDFEGYTVQTWVGFGPKKQYVENTIVENIVSYCIPAALSLGARDGVAETRIFKDGDVFEVLRVNITVHKAGKPDTEPAA